MGYARKKFDLFLIVIVIICMTRVLVSADDFSTNVQIEEMNPELSQTKLSMNLSTGYLITWWSDVEGYYGCDGNLLIVRGVEKKSVIEVRVLDEEGEQTQNIYVTKRYDYDEGCYRICFYPNSVGKYIAEVIAVGKTMYCELNVLNMFFERHPKTVADRGSETWLAAYSMLALYPKETAKLTVNGASGKVSWKSSDKRVVIVDSHGKVTAKGAGYAKISATCGDVAITYLIGVADRRAILAVRECCAMYGETIYSQEKRMIDGYADCSSFVWKGYKAAGVALSSPSYAPSAAGLSDWCKEKGYRIFYGEADMAALLPGDLIFECGDDNGRSDGIYHVDIYLGNYAAITVRQEKWYGIFTRDSEVSFMDDGYGHDYLLQCFWDDLPAKNTLNDVIVARPCMSVVSGVVVENGVGHCQTVSWKSQYGVSGYEIYRSNSKSGKYKKVATVKGSDTVKWTSGELTKGQTYYYKVRAYWKADGVVCRAGYSAVVGMKVK